MTRQEDIAYSFLKNDRIWPRSCAPTNFVKALVEVLERLPEDAYDEVENFVSFVVELPPFTAINVPFNRAYPPSPSVREIRFDTIVVFHAA